LLLVAAVAVLISLPGGQGLGLLVTALLAACAMLVGAYWFLAHRGPLRWLGFALAVLAPVAIVLNGLRLHLIWVAAVAVAIVLLAIMAGRAAMGGARRAQIRERAASRPNHPFLIMNPRSGGGKVARFGLRERAESLGADVAMLEGPQTVDVAALARKAVADGADLLGVAGGDGTQALVAGIAAENGVPFLCISAGTRNHFAMDLGLDRDDPARGLDALTDGVEIAVDLGRIGDRTFVNNASFGAYAEVVRSPAYRDDKRGTTLSMLPDLLSGHGDGHELRARVVVPEARGTRTVPEARGTSTVPEARETSTVPEAVADIDGPQALLVSNNPYDMTDPAGLGRRARLDGGTLGVIAVKVDNAAQAVGLLRRGHGKGLTFASGTEVTVSSADAQIPVGIDGETVMMATPVHCTIEPGALRVVVPRTRPGVPSPRPEFSWSRLGRLAGFGSVN
jgi:diacylglycerol kinase family enzyme